MTTITLFIASFIFIAFKSFQQLNVMKRNYIWIIPVSLVMAVCGVFEIAMVSHYGLGLATVLPIGFGGGLGSITATYLHNRIFESP